MTELEIKDEIDMKISDIQNYLFDAECRIKYLDGININVKGYEKEEIRTGLYFSIDTARANISELKRLIELLEKVK